MKYIIILLRLYQKTFKDINLPQNQSQ